MWTTYFNAEPSSIDVSGVLHHDNGQDFPFTGRQHVDVTIADTAPHGWGGWLEVSAPGYSAQRIRVSVVAPALLREDGSALGVVLVSAELPRVTVNGLDLVANGSRWVYNGASHFLALLRLLVGQDVIDYPGPNVVRVFGTMVNVPGQAGLPPLTPDGFPGYFDGLSRLADLLSARGQYLDFCALADIQLLGWSVAKQQSFIANCASVLSAKTNVLFDLGNEPWANGWQPENFTRPALPCACSRGSVQDADGHDGYPGPGGAWDCIRVHTRRDFPKMLTHCALPDPLYTYGKPIIVDEPFKLCDPTHGGYFDPRLAQIAGDLGRGVSGICYHCPGGVMSVPWTPQEAVCAAAFFG